MHLGFYTNISWFFTFLEKYSKKHSFYHGCIRTEWNSVGGLSLGLFIFVPANSWAIEHKEECIGTQIYSENEYCKMISVHEYGHTIQSLLLGPFYFIPAIWSVIWSSSKRYQNLRKRYGVPYTFSWSEQWADFLGEYLLHQPSAKNLFDSSRE